MKLIFRLNCGVQNYAWGKIGAESKVAELSQNASKSHEIKSDEPYAELWMGTHVNCPSYDYESGEMLSEILLKNPEVLLSNDVAAKYNKGELPFLFKVLSVNKALSIQAHPDKKLAEELFQKFPKIYKDDNHKPEMAIALTDFEALCGFRVFDEIKGNLDRFPELAEVIGTGVVNKFVKSPSKESFRALFQGLMTANESLVSEKLTKLCEKLSSNGKKFAKGTNEELLIRLNNQYPGDVGCFCALLLNYVILKPDEALFLSANEPHAYLSGDCIECMATSDNVVRSGLTPKFKDVQTLVKMLTYKTYSVSDIVLKGKGLTTNSCKYDSLVPEFSVLKHSIPSIGPVEVPSVVGPSIFVIVEGSGQLVSQEVTLNLDKGVVFFVGHKQKFIIKASKDLKAFQAAMNK